ncbi:T9SS type A sorting domain-containing protein [Pontibacter beigongshangensis]|uniref:T9SS type A sorting domain-containing protein n=1 Tax=Pontibacter beigongshangensis TaxID=2574733 RepID=UPI00164EDF5A|nr:T9SS type A sorting domain-containing protein [Pontibacter beigongshangensis]
MGKLLLKNVAAVLVVAGAFSVAQAQNLPGSNDASFNTADAVVAAGFNSTVYTVALQADSKIVVGGNFNSLVGGGNRIARLNADGSLDNSFNTGAGFNTAVRSLALQPDGKIVVGGNFTSFNGIDRNRIARLNADGTLDASFNPGAGFAGSANSSVQSLALQPDGKIVVGGNFTSFNGIDRNRIARLNADGTLDASFNPGAGFTGSASSSVQSLALQPDGKIMVGGSFSYDNGIKRYDIARLNADGTLDTSFDTPTNLIGPIYSIALQPDGKVVIGGSLLLFHNGTRISMITRLNADGTLDSSFDSGGTFGSFNNTVRSVALQPDGKIVVGGEFTAHNSRWCNYIARLNADGTNDASFNPGKGFTPYNPGQGTGFNFPVYSVALQSDGKIVAGGDFSSYNGTRYSKIARLNGDGTVDGSFIGKGFNDLVRSIVLQPDGKIVVGGDFTHYNGTPRSRIARLHADGTLDASFDPGTGFNSDDWPIRVYALALQSDGKIVVGGWFTSFNGTEQNRIVRLNADGSLDNSFNTGAGFNTAVQSLTLQPNGKVVVGGSFDSFNGIGRNGIARLNTDGTLDDSFNPGTSFNAIAAQPDGKIVLGRRITSSDGTWRDIVVRLHADGTLDTSFIETGFDGPIHFIALQSDGKIVVGGRFTSSDGTERNRVARLNADGTLDTSFNPEFKPGGSNGTVYSIALQPNGKIVVAGTFSLNTGTVPSYSITRLNADGTLDASFNPGTGFNSEVRSVVLQPDGKIVAGGWFTTYNQIPRTRIARLFGDEGSSLSTGKELQAGLEVLVYPNPSQGDVHLLFTGTGALVGAVKLVLHDSKGRQVLSREVTVAEVQAGVQLDTSSLPGGVYFLNIQSKEKAIIKRLVLTE